jgi:hypothetical protein
MQRAGYVGFMRNVAIALGNWLAVNDAPDGEAIGVLLGGLEV